MTPRHMLAVFLMFPIAWLVYSAWAAAKHADSPTPENEEHAMQIARFLLEDDTNKPLSNGPVDVNGVYWRFLGVVAIYAVIGFLLGYGVCLCVHP